MEKYGVINYPDGNKYYEGFVRESDGAPWGAGCSFWPDGTKYQEGLFGLKGLLCGREYYPNGNIRFEGYCGLHRGYGPNYPRYGIFFSEDGEEIFSGRFGVVPSGVGWPNITKPAEFGPVLQKSAPRKPKPEE